MTDNLNFTITYLLQDLFLLIDMIDQCCVLSNCLVTDRLVDF